MSQAAAFSPALFEFLRDLEQNNDREWFDANKNRYEDSVREPALAFISAFGPKLRTISPHFLAIPKKVGGSLFRIHRDVRFSKDKRPYKTSVGIQFRHSGGKDAHAPGFYLHLAPGDVFCAGGTWHPDKDTLEGIRQGIATQPGEWRALIEAPKFQKNFKLEGESLKRPPRGFDADHPCLDDLKRKDFIAVARLTEKDATKPGFMDRFTDLCTDLGPFVSFLSRAAGVDF